MRKLISVTEAETIITSELDIGSTEIIPLHHAAGRYLRQDIMADRDLPPFDRVMMDGIAINHQSWLDLNREFSIEGTQAAGSPSLSLKNHDNCIEVMTGCMLPTGCDCIIPIEQITITDGVAHIQICANLTKGQHIHKQGSDTPSGNTLLTSGTLLTSPELSIAASCGISEIKVAALPRLLVISTGDELVAPHEAPDTHQIRRSHFTALHTSISTKNLGILEELHIADDPEALRKAVQHALSNYEIIILTGGVSRGKYDYVAPVLEEQLGTPHFHGVAQRPGKPFAFWKNKSSPYVFALPGNPVSVMACTARYVLPALYQIATGQPFTPSHLSTSGKSNRPKHLTALTPSILKNGKLTLEPPSNSGNFFALEGTHGVAQISGNLSGSSIMNEPVDFYPW